MKPDKPQKEHKVFFAILSLLLAFSFWFYIRIIDDPETDDTVSDIPVTILGESVLENQGMILSSVSHDKVSLSWSGAWSIVRQLNKSNVSISLDVTRISGPGTFDLYYTVNYPSSVSANALSRQKSDPEYITVTVERVDSKPFTITPVHQGGVAEGYLAGDFAILPDVVTITGTEELVDRIASVQAVLDQKELNKSFAGDLPLILLDADGNELDAEGLRMSATTVYATLPVMMVKEIPLDIELIPGGGASRDNVDLHIDPLAITVAGPEEIVQTLNKVSLGSIDLSQIMDTYTDSYNIYLPSGVENVSGITAAAVHVDVQGLTTEAFNVRDIQLYNAPAGYRTDLRTKECTVMVRGTEEALEQLHESQLSIVVDLTDYTTRGSFRVPVRVYVAGSSEVGVIGEYTVVVNITR